MIRQPLAFAALYVLEAVVSGVQEGLGRKRNDVWQGRGRDVDGSSRLYQVGFDA